MVGSWKLNHLSIKWRVIRKLLRQRISCLGIYCLIKKAKKQGTNHGVIIETASPSFRKWNNSIHHQMNINDRLGCFSFFPSYLIGDKEGISDCNRTRTHNHLVRSTIQPNWRNDCVVSTYLYCVFDCILLSYHVRVSE